jgi:hypothetical protein
MLIHCALHLLRNELMHPRRRVDKAHSKVLTRVFISHAIGPLVIRIARVAVIVIRRWLREAVGVFVSDEIEHEAEHVVVDHFAAEL